MRNINFIWQQFGLVSDRPIDSLVVNHHANSLLELNKIDWHELENIVCHSDEIVERHNRALPTDCRKARHEQHFADWEIAFRAANGLH